MTCSNGKIVLECHPEWAPLGAARFRELVESGYFNGARFFRVVPNFVVQFGIAGDPELSAKWRTNDIKDDPVVQSNRRGTLSFASAGPNTRTSQIFLNLVDNGRLDGMRFAPFAEVTKGLDVMDAICAEYLERPDQGRIHAEGNAYLEEAFPNLDFIKKATVSKK
ncbi:MAG: peptidylprolyl isomerase [bacterium]|nr:peptidylprolyl isomerase [bacterium]